jgi:hypothetical protein
MHEVIIYIRVLGVWHTYSVNPYESRKKAHFVARHWRRTHRGLPYRFRVRRVG